MAFLWSAKAVQEQRDINRVVYGLIDDEQNLLKHQILPTLVRTDEDIPSGSPGKCRFLYGKLSDQEADTATVNMWNMIADGFIPEGSTCLAVRVAGRGYGKGEWVLIRAGATQTGSSIDVFCRPFEEQNAPNQWTITLAGATTTDVGEPGAYISLTDADRQDLADDINGAHTLTYIAPCEWQVEESVTLTSLEVVTYVISLTAFADEQNGEAFWLLSLAEFWNVDRAARVRRNTIYTFPVPLPYIEKTYGPLGWRQDIQFFPDSNVTLDLAVFLEPV